MKVVEKTCEVCGKTFMGKKRTKYCSRECCVKMARRNYRQTHKEVVQKPKAAKKEAPKKIWCASWEKVLKGMEKTGLQYGYYVAMTEGDQWVRNSRSR